MEALESNGEKAIPPVHMLLDRAKDKAVLLEEVIAEES